MSSSEQSIDPQLVEQTKNQIRSLVNEIADLSRQADITAEQFYSELLPRIVTALAAVGGVVWTREEDGRLGLRYQVNLRESRLAELDEETQLRHARLLHRVMQTGEGLLVGPHSGPGAADETSGTNPTDFLLVMGPLKTELEAVGVVEIFQRPDTPPPVQQGYLRFLLQMCELAADFLKSRQLRHFSDRQVLWTQLEEFTRLIHASLNPRDTAYTIANEGRRLIECDRVSVAIRKGDKYTVEAVSGQDMFDKRANTIRLLNRLATVVAASGEPVWYTGDTSGMAPQVEEAIEEYADESHTKTIAVLPLKRPDPPEQEKERADDKPEVNEPVGALIVEQIEDARLPAKMLQRTDVVCRHSGTALANAVEHEGLFLMPVWRMLGKSRWLVRARTLPKTISVGVAVLVAIVALIVVPARFRVQGKGTLEPVDRRDVYATVDGEVVEVLVDSGHKVRKGDLLVRLRNSELQAQLASVIGQRDAAKRSLDDISMRLDDSHLSPEERSQKTLELSQLIPRYNGYKAQAAQLEAKAEQLKVRAPIDGQVVTWDVKKNLMGRAVQPGHQLLRIATIDAAGAWELELRTPEDRMGHIARAQEVKRAVVREKLRARLGEEELAKIPENKLAQRLEELTGEKIDDQLDVSYILATEPGRTNDGKAVDIAWAADVRGDEGNVVLVRVAIDKNEILPEHLRAGAEATAKIDCGRRSLGYVWFHDVIAFVKKIWFRWF